MSHGLIFKRASWPVARGNGHGCGCPNGRLGRPTCRRQNPGLARAMATIYRVSTMAMDGRWSVRRWSSCPSVERVETGGTTFRVCPGRVLSPVFSCEDPSRRIGPVRLVSVLSETMPPRLVLYPLAEVMQDAGSVKPSSYRVVCCAVGQVINQLSHAKHVGGPRRFHLVNNNEGRTHCESWTVGPRSSCLTHCLLNLALAAHGTAYEYIFLPSISSQAWISRMFCA